MKWTLTFSFEDTEEQAKQFCEEVYNGYSPYAKRKFKKPTTYYWTAKDGSGAWIVWYRSYGL